MKRILLNTTSACMLLSALCGPFRGAAQCVCSEGEAPTPIEHIFTLDTTLASTTLLTFPKFDPTIGTLSCITLHDTLSIVSMLGIGNKDSIDKTYTFRLTVTTNVLDPDLHSVRSNFVDKTYGPDLLGGDGSPTDSTVYGPDTLFNNVPASGNVSDISAFLGTGNVNMTYEIGGGVASLAGGINYNQSVTTRTWGVFKLTYYWCPAIILAANIKSFSAVKDNGRVNLNWLVENEETDNTYELQVSHNGRQFKAVNKFKAQEVPEGAAAYDYQYLLQQVTHGKIYFRVKQVNAAGKASYSVVRFVDAAMEQKPGSVIVYPNPVRRQVSMQFGKTLNGSYKVELFNLTGQVVYQRIHRMNNTNSLLFEIPGTPAGIYFLRARNIHGNETFTGKLTVQY